MEDLEFTGFKIVKNVRYVNWGASIGGKLEFYRKDTKIWEQDIDPIPEVIFNDLRDYINNG